MSEPYGTPPGWYAVGATGELQWWDGQQWTGHTYRYPQPAAPTAAIPPGADVAPATVEAPVPTHTAASWLIAVTPLMLAIIAVLVVVSDVPGIAVFAIIGFTSLLLLPASIALSLWDVSTLRKRGSSMAMAHALWVLLGGWVYLLVRAIVLKGSDRERWVVLAFTFVAGVLTAIVFGASFASLLSDEDFRRDLFYDRDYMEGAIERGIMLRQDAAVEADCPDEPPVSDGDTFECVITTDDGQPYGVAIVTWRNNFGAYSWIVHQGVAPSINQA